MRLRSGGRGQLTALTASRRERPTEDLASAIANARIDGEPLSDVDTASYYVIIATAGHDTTSATIAGGLQALIWRRRSPTPASTASRCRMSTPPPTT